MFPVLKELGVVSKLCSVKTFLPTPSMLNNKIDLYLASNSPRRKKMLHSLGINFKQLAIEHEEIISANETPLKNVKRLAKEKCEKAFQKLNKGIIISADTIVVFEGKIIGKPTSKKNAIQILKQLSGKTHIVYTGYAVGDASTKIARLGYEKTSVTFYQLSKEQIEEYVDSGSPMDKAGAYGIQDDYGSLFVKKINGCYNNVVGFPIAKIFRTLEMIT